MEFNEINNMFQSLPMTMGIVEDLDGEDEIPDDLDVRLQKEYTKQNFITFPAQSID